MYYPEELIEEVRERNDIVDVISGYVGLQKRGSNYVCCCPFHNEKTPSFSVNRTRQIYKCFGCGEGGNVMTFVQKYENCTFLEAVKILADRVGIKLPEAEYSEEAREKQNRRHQLLEINKEAAKFYYYQLRTPIGEKARAYLDKRELTDETRKNFGLGFAPANGRGLLEYLKGKGYSDELVRATGLTKYDEKRGAYTLFWDRVMYPIQDINHRVIGFGGRVMGDGEPKYLNSPETEIFDKGRNLYGMNYARAARTGNIILCEGYMDVIQMHQAGFTQAVASLGTAFTSGQAALIKKYTSNVLLAYDSDGAGVKAALRALEILRNSGMSGKIINMSPYKDPDEFIKNRGKAAFQERIDQAENSFLFEIRMLERNFDMSDPEGKTRFYNQMATKLCRFSEEVERETYIATMADKYNMSIDALRKLVVSTAAKNGGYDVVVERPRTTTRQKSNPEENEKKAQRILLTWITEEPWLYENVRRYVMPSDFTNDIYRKAAVRIFSDIEAGKLNPASVINMFEDEKEQSEVTSLFTTKLERLDSPQEKEKAFKDVLLKVKTYSLENINATMATDPGALNRYIQGKKELEELKKDLDKIVWRT